MGLNTCADVQQYDVVTLIKSMGKFGQVLWERCHAIDERPVNPDRLRKSVGVERTLAKDIHQWSDCLSLLDKLYDELQLRLAKVKPDLRIARQGVKFKFDDFQQTTQEHVYPILNKQDLVQLAQQVWENRRLKRGVRLVGVHVMLQSPQLERQLLLEL